MNYARSIFDCRLLTWVLIAIFAGALAGCHGGSGTAEEAAEEEPGGVTGTILGAAGSVRDGFILEFPESMDTASVEASVAVAEGDFTDASAAISKAEFLASAGKAAEVNRLHFVWEGDTKVRVAFAARYGLFYTLFLDNSTAMTAAGQELASVAKAADENTSVYGGEVGPNPDNFDGDDDETGEFALLNWRGEMQSALVFTHQELAELAVSISGIDISGIPTADYWRYLNGYLKFDSVNMGRLSDDVGSTMGTMTDEDYLMLLRYDTYEEGEKGPVVIPAMTIKMPDEKGAVSVYGPVGDLNADGYDDFMFAGHPTNGEVGVYIVTGSETFFDDHGESPAIDDLYTAGYTVASAADFTFCSLAGENADMKFAAGNFDGDEYGDIAFCYNYGGTAKNIIKADPAGGALQMIHLYFGDSTLSDDIFGGPTIINTPLDSGMTLGEAKAADINGDLIADIIVPYKGTTAITKSIAIYDHGLLIFFGAKGDRSTKSVPADVDVNISLGEATSISLAMLGNIDSDCCSDIAAVTRNTDPETNEQLSYLFFIKGAKADEWERNVDLSGSGSFGSASETGQLYTRLIGYGELDNDGYADIGILYSDFMDNEHIVVLGGGRDAGAGEFGMGNLGGFKLMAQIKGFDEQI